MNIDAFQPNGATVNITATTTTGSVALTGVGTGANVRLYNAGAVTVFINFGTSTVTASLSTSYPLLAGSVEVLAVPSATHLAAITASSTAVVYATTGQGI